VLLNLYRDGRDSVAWHSDYEGRHGGRVVIASLTLGAVRRFMFRPKPGREGATLAFDLPAGSLLLMGDGCQEHWEHHVPKTARPVGPRINLTFRQLPRSDRTAS
jgi:alkylated DNA repair dioxygenase AlkB